MIRLFQKRAETVENSITMNDVLLQALLDRKCITKNQAMNIPAFSGCVSRICDTVAIIPIALYQKNEKSIEKIENDARVKLLNDDTKDTLTGIDFKKAIVFDYLTGKGGYAFINRAGNRFLSLNYVRQDQVSFAENSDPIFKDYKIYVNGKGYEGYQFLKVIRRTKDGYKGSSIIEENQQILKVAYNSLLFESDLVKKGGTKKGFLQAEKKLTDPAIDVLKKAFSKMYMDGEESVIVLNDGIKFQESSNTSVEMQLNENKKQNDIEICKIFPMPPAVLSGGATEKDWQVYIQYCIMPILSTLVAAINRDMLLEKEKDTYFFAPDVTELTKGDIKTRYDAYKTAISGGFMQVDEVRMKENLPTIGMPFIELGLQNVLYDPISGNIYTPNTNKWVSIKGENVLQTDGDTDKSTTDQKGGNNADTNQS